MLRRVFLFLAFLPFLASCSGLQVKPWRNYLERKAASQQPVYTTDFLKATALDSVDTLGELRDGKCCFRIHSYDLRDDLGEYQIIRVNDGATLWLQDYHGRLLSAKFESRYWFYDLHSWHQYWQDTSDEPVILPKVGTSPEASQAYFELLGAFGQNEYGWICEYGTIGMPPDQRRAILHLVREREVDLIRTLLQGPNLEGHVYAADALLYLEHLGHPIQEADRKAIEAMYESNEVVRTCGNAGSYKIYPIPFSEVLDDSAIADIPSLYESLLSKGW